MICRICEGNPKRIPCMICGLKPTKDKNEIAIRKAYYQEMKRVWNNFRKAQQRHVIVPPFNGENEREVHDAKEEKEFQDKIRRMFGEWLEDVVEKFAPTIMVLYTEAHHLETVIKNKKKARLKYMQLFQVMKPTDRIHFRITRSDIERKIKELTPIKSKAKR